jgi:multisubunit Na+/H+ antiporter MnhG subunit
VTEMPALRAFNPVSRPPLGEYLRVALASIFTSVRLRHPDLLLSTSFWGGFGWVDTLLPEPLVTGLVIVSALLALRLAIGVARKDDERRAVWIGLLAAGWTAAIVLTTMASYFLNRNLHGRYLLGVYLTVLAVAWTAPVIARLQRGRAPAPPTVVVMAGLTAVAALHAFALTVILRRYF